MENSMLIWFVVGLILLVGELALPGLVIFFFGLGAWVVAGICAITDISLNAQLIVFLLTSIILLFILRGKLAKIFRGKNFSYENESESLDESVISSRDSGVVILKIVPGHNGRVEVGGTSWEAVSTEVIEVGVPVLILKRDRLKLHVAPIKK